jgi:ABC-type oligopeptide transport system ATPase subunit
MIIGLCGHQGCGKTTVANILCERFGFIHLSFASILKDIVAILFSWDRTLLEGDTPEGREWRETVDKWWSTQLDIPDFTPRKALQYIGTNVMRNSFHKNIWILAIEKKLENHKKIVISDCRFLNEVKTLRKHGAYIIRIERENTHTTSHESEAEWQKIIPNHVIINDTLDKLNDDIGFYMLSIYNEL